MMKKVMIGFGMMVIGGVLMIAYNLIGSEIDGNGFLHEPFFLIPIGVLFIFLGIGWSSGCLLLALVKKLQRKEGLR